MGRIADLDAELHELPDFEKGIQAERERITILLNIVADEYLADKLLVESAIIHNAIASIKETND
jgi:uncharacterized protein YeeX (DUF496 family)